MSSIISIKTAFHKVFTFWGKARLRRHMLATLNDRLLMDMGFSPELLKQGVSAWPWRLAGEFPAPENQPQPTGQPVAVRYHGDIGYIAADTPALSGQTARRAA